ncbi:MAG: SMP-30/gluconolactonase/LRE family protein [SAR202 cluster bacterium]|nr:SMP-30/gluconolactonase/LRE family protein [SAR202 cluster bacterium]|tara:strand:+ start:987 stop:1907 length:921 start_codon:yes stop_codon:yes gene_type:complete
MISNSIELIADGLFFPEGPRWSANDQKLYFSDVLAGKVLRTDCDGTLETVFEPGEYPSGLGFLGNGDLLVVGTESHSVLRLPSEKVVKGNAKREDSMDHADISSIYNTGNNDMVVAPNGNAYAGAYIPGLSEEQPPGPDNPPQFGNIVLVRIDGSTEAVADRVCFPNGGAITPDGRTLIVAETFAFTLTAWDIEDDGTLSNRRPFANLAAPTDGISLDTEGCVWVACPYFSYGDSGGWVRVGDGGEVKQVIPLENSDKSAYACMLGGEDGRDLWLCESTVLGRERFQGDGRVRRVRVDVPKAASQF